MVDGTGRLGGKRAVVTGAGRGIGRAIALAFAREGAAVVCSGRQKGPLDEVAGVITDEGGRADVVCADVTKDDDVAELARQALTSLGGVDVLVNNAGIYAPGAFMEHELDDWQRVLDVNVLGVVRVTRAFLPAMLGAGSGRIVNIASTAGKYGSLYQSPYNASKHAVVGLTRCLALETAGGGVTVNAICPGFVRTDMIGQDAYEVFAGHMGCAPEEVEDRLLSRVPIGRQIEPEEVAELAVYLASDGSQAMTGHAVTLSGGLILI
ncbi:MAG TPA: SDR family NAD(P)-dependent oxidoreductase [Candidatus Tectomicrobia bacterium]|nr:SDR family NAD(P)-dependent oxidoreductase [Candidatus Tectomicrobia bacterium]